MLTHLKFINLNQKRNKKQKNTLTKHTEQIRQVIKQLIMISEIELDKFLNQTFNKTFKKHENLCNSEYRSRRSIFYQYGLGEINYCFKSHSSDMIKIAYIYPLFCLLYFYITAIKT
jgi:hypothetical protein